MIGKSQIQITGNEFAGGLSTSDYLGDGGIGVLSQNINPVLSQGTIYATSVQTQTGLPNNAILATTEDFENQSQASRWLVDANSGTVHYLDSSNVIHTTPRGGSGVYTLGISDAVPFKYNPDGTSALFMTSANDIDVVYGNISSGLLSKNNYWTVATGLNQSPLLTGIPHPLLVYQRFLWVGDGKNLHSISEANVVVNSALTLDQNEEITALGIDPGTGYMMIGVRSVTAGLSPNIPATCFIYLFDGYSPKPRRKVPVHGVPWSFQTCGGEVMAGIDNTICVWNGNGVTFKRRLSSASSIPYKHLTAVVNNQYFVADQNTVLGYGDILNGSRVWYPVYKNANANINTVWRQSRSVLGLNDSTTTAKFISILDTSYGAGTGTFYTNNIYFPRPVHIHRMRVFTTGITTTAGIGSVTMINEKAQTLTPTVSKFVVASGTQYVFDFTFGGVKLETMQPVITLDTQTFGIVKVVIYYDTAE